MEDESVIATVVLALVGVASGRWVEASSLKGKSTNLSVKATTQHNAHHN